MMLDEEEEEEENLPHRCYVSVQKYHRHPASSRGQHPPIREREHAARIRVATARLAAGRAAPIAFRW